MFVGDSDWQLMPYEAQWRDGDRVVTAVVRWDDGDEGDELFIAQVDGVRHPITEEADLLGIAPPGAVVVFERGGVCLSMWTGEAEQDAAGQARTRFHAVASSEVGNRTLTGAIATGSDASATLEQAVMNLGEAEPDRSAPRVCFLCAHSDYEPGTGWGGGHLACFLTSAERYRAAATSDDAWTRKYGPWSWLTFTWVDELGTCESWERRPPNHGYRG